MTTITFIPKSSAQFVNWNDPTVWSGGVVPNDPTVDVVIPTTTVVSTGQSYTSAITEIGTNAINSLAISNNDLLLNGTLNVTHSVSISTGGEIDMNGGILSAESIDNNGIDIQGSGTVNVSGALFNKSEIIGHGLNVTAATMNSPGLLVADASGTLTVTVAPGGFSALTGTALTAGSYQAIDNSTLFLNIGAIITTDAATIALRGNGSIASYDSVAAAYVPITSSMQTIAAAGTLTLDSGTFNWSGLTVDGSITLLSKNAELVSTHLTVHSGGSVGGVGTLDGPITDSGTIIAGSPQGSLLRINGPVSGDGILKIALAQETTQFLLGGITTFNFTHPTLELAEATSTDVVFGDSHGILVLDNPSSFTGHISRFVGQVTPTDSGDEIILGGISLSSVTSYSYAGDHSGGTLTVHTASGTTNLAFIGDFVTADFSLQAGPQNLSSDPPSIIITNTVVPPHVRNDFYGDGNADILWQNDNGQADIWPMNGVTTSGGVFIGNNPGNDWHVKAAADFNGDSKADILWQNDNGQADIWLMNGVTPAAGVFVGNNPGSDWHVKAAADFNGDGKADILWQNDNGQADIWLMNGVRPAAGVFVGNNPGNDWHVKAAADFNGDGKADILWQNDNGQADIWLMNGVTPSAGVIVGINPGPTWQVLDAGDFNGDGKADILWQSDNGQAAIWLMNGTTVLSQVGVGPNPGPSWHVKAAADFNGDGKADILWQNTDGSPYIWLMDGAAVTGTSSPGGNPGADWHIIA